MDIRSIALKNILKKKMIVEDKAEKTLSEVLKIEKIRGLFVECKMLIVEIAKLEVAGQSAKGLRDKYNSNRDEIAKLLVENGYLKSDLKPKYNCKLCKDTGVVGGKDCECLKNEMSRVLASLSGINLDNFSKFNDDYSCFKDKTKIKTIYDKMKKFVLNIDSTPVDTILLVGDTGVGKTHLIECMASLCIETNKVVKYATAFSFNQDMLKYHCASLDDKSDIVDVYLNCDVLFLDDLGSENKIKNVTNEYLYLVLNERMLNHKKTVITTNLNLAQIQDVYGERIFSRLMHKKHSLKIKMEGKDLRVGLDEK